MEMFKTKDINDTLSKYLNILSKNIKSIINTDLGSLELVNKILKCQSTGNHVVLMGIGKNVYLCQKIAASFSSIGIKSYYLDPVHAVHGDFGMLNQNDLIIAISKSGSTLELTTSLTHLMNNIEHFNVDITGICCNKNNCDFKDLGLDVISLDASNEIDEINKVPMVSLITIQIYLDCIGVIVAKEQGFTSEQFKVNHPGGVIGKTI